MNGNNNNNNGNGGMTLHRWQGVNRSVAQIGSAFIQSVIAHYMDNHGRIQVVLMKNLEGIIGAVVYEMLLKKAVMDTHDYIQNTLLQLTSFIQ